MHARRREGCWCGGSPQKRGRPPQLGPVTTSETRPSSPSPSRLHRALLCHATPQPHARGPRGALPHWTRRGKGGPGRWQAGPSWGGRARPPPARRPRRPSYLDRTRQRHHSGTRSPTVTALGGRVARRRHPPAPTPTSPAPAASAASPPPRRRRLVSRPPAVNAFPVGRRRRRSIRARGDPRPSVRRGRLPLLPRRRSASHARAIRSSALAPRGRKGEVTFPPPSIPPLLRPPPPPPPPRVAAPWRAVVAWRRRPRMERARRPGQVAQKLSQALPLCRLDDPPWPNPDEELRHRAERHRKGPKGHRVGSLLRPLRHPRRHETLPAVRPSSTKPRGSRLRRTTATPRRHPPRVKT